VLLRRALTSEGRAGFLSAKSFMDEFFGVSLHPSIVAHTDRLRSITATVSHNTEAQQPLISSLVTVRQAVPPPLPVAVVAKPPPLLVRASLSVRSGDREAAG